MTALTVALHLQTLSWQNASQESDDLVMISKHHYKSTTDVYLQFPKQLCALYKGIQLGLSNWSISIHTVTWQI